MTDILRDEWGFDGIVVSDWGGNNDPVKAVEAGANLEMPNCGYGSAREIVKAVKDCRLSQKKLDERVSELLSVIMELADRKSANLPQDKVTGKTQEHKQEGGFDREAHHRLAKKAAAESMVLLKMMHQFFLLTEPRRLQLSEILRLHRDIREPALRW